jgi:hypothetical protein
MPKLLTHVSSRQKCIEMSSNSEYVIFCFPPLVVMLQDGLIWDQVLYWRGALPTIGILVRDWMVAIGLHYKLALINWNNFSYSRNTCPDTKVSIRNLVLICESAEFPDDTRGSRVLFVMHFYLICQTQCQWNPVSHTHLSASLFMQHWNYIKVSKVKLRSSYLILRLNNAELIYFFLNKMWNGGTNLAS